MNEDELNAIIRELDGQIDLELTGFQTSEINNILSQIEEMNEVPDSVPLDADNDSTVTNLPFISYGAKKIYMQPDAPHHYLCGVSPPMCGAATSIWHSEKRREAF